MTSLLHHRITHVPLLHQVTIGVFGYAETTIMEPLSPKEIVKIIYDMCFPSDPIEAVLQQEVGVVPEVM